MVAASPIARLVAWARERRWPHLRFVSTDGNRYSRDYYGETTRVPDAVLVERGFQAGEHRDETMSNVFRLDDAGKVRHFWGSELAWAPMEPGQDHRANDAFDTLWSVLDLTPEGRGTFRPQLAYQEERRSLRGFD